MTDGHPLRPACSSTRHSSLGDQKSLEAEALAEVEKILVKVLHIVNKGACSFTHTLSHSLIHLPSPQAGSG